MTTTLHAIQLSCPNCESCFESIAPGAAPSGASAEFRIPQGFTSILPFLVHVCGRCGWAGMTHDFGSDVEVAPEVAARVWTELAPRLPVPSRLSHLAFAISGSEKYELAARVAEWRWADSRSVAELWHRGALCCAFEGDSEAERYFRICAAWFTEALESFDGVHPHERADLTYLLGELWLEIGDARRAREWFARVADEIVDADLQRGIIQAARERAMPDEWAA
jgi:uncharacterized protein